jgi:hypothetical protein
VDFYVVAFTDAPMKRRRIKGRSYEVIPLGGLFAIGERRAAAPLATDDELRHQHDVVVRIAADASAILPVRFGAMTTIEVLESLPSQAIARLAGGLTEVRGRVQMTIRFVGEPPPAVSPTRGGSGRDYLQNRRAAMRPELPRAAADWLRTLRSIAARERLEPGVGSLLATAYHLVDKVHLDRYTRSTAGAEAVGARLTGPYPPFAFTPSIL